MSDVADARVTLDARQRRLLADIRQEVADGTDSREALDVADAAALDKAAVAAVLFGEQGRAWYLTAGNVAADRNALLAYADNCDSAAARMTLAALDGQLPAAVDGARAYAAHLRRLADTPGPVPPDVLDEATLMDFTAGWRGTIPADRGHAIGPRYGLALAALLRQGRLERVQTPDGPRFVMTAGPTQTDTADDHIQPDSDDDTA
nr:hypothetical protein GCM10020063_001830 [Dactylosporangium thailandense]